MLSLNIYILIPFISTILYFFIYLIISTSNETKLSRTFKYYIIAMIIWSLGSFLMKADIAPNALFWNKYVLQTGYVFVPVSLLGFSYVLINKSNRNAVLITSIVMSFLLILLSFSGNVINRVDVTENGIDYGITWGAYVVAIINSLITILAFVTMIKAIRQNQVELKKVRLVLIGLSLVIIGGALNISPEVGKIGIDIILNAFSAVLITYSIYRNKFLEINLIVKRGLYFSIYNILLFILYATVVIAVYNFFTRLFEENIFVLLLIMSPIFMVLDPIRRLLERWTKKMFYGANQDRQIILNEFSSLVSQSFSLEQINNSLLHAIKEGIDSEHVSILLKNSTKYKLFDTTIEQIDFSIQNIPFHSPVVSWIDEQGILLNTEINNNVTFKRLWDEERRVLQRFKTEIIVPIKYLGEIIGLVIISAKTDDTPYIEEEIQFLKTILNNAAAIIENAKTIENLKTQSITDELTKLYNHRYFHETVNNWMKENPDMPFSIAVIDIDQFKIYNDLYGHSAGDKALKRIAQLVTEIAPKDSLLVRYAGDQIAIYYPNCDQIKTKMAIDNVRKIIEENFLLSNDIREFLTVSVGAACYPEHGSNLEDVLTKSFQAVLNCKQSGRNKSIIYSASSDAVDEVHQNVQNKIKEAYLSSTYALAATIDAKDHYTYGHSNNVSVLAVALAEKAGYSGEDLETIKNAGLLHDIGKVGIPESVLLKKGFLNEKEVEIMRSHVVQSISIIKHIPNLVDTIPIIISHHERYDGGGYPRGIQGENIPVLGRIICIADSFDAMTTDRPYRKGLSKDQAMFELKKNAGSQFDPKLVDLFLEIIEENGLENLDLKNRLSF